MKTTTEQKTDTNLKAYLSVAESCYFDITARIEELKEEMKNAKSLESLEQIEKSLQTIHTMYALSMQHIVDNYSK